MYLEAVSVCVGYSDFLRETAPLNKSYFDRWVIVTSKDDQDTMDVCHWLSLPFVTTDDFGRNGGGFNKGRGIQRGLDNLACRDFIMHIDADIVLPPEFPQALQMAHLEERKIYGCDRMNVTGWDAWKKVKESGYRQHGRHCYVLPHDRYGIGTRWASPTHGYVPIGFTQIFHANAVLHKGIWQKPYLHHHSHAARSDVQFGLQWDRRDRELIPELLVWHLESEPAGVGANWNGRTTKPFGPEGTPVPTGTRGPLVAGSRGIQPS
jgi:hypothetical protein